MQNPRQRVRGPVLMYGPACLSFSPPDYRGKGAFVQVKSDEPDKKPRMRFRIPPLDRLDGESLSILRLLKPSPDLLIVGTGDENMPLPKAAQDFLAQEVREFSAVFVMYMYIYADVCV